MSGNPTILEVGGPAYLLPLVQKEKVYDIKNLAPHLNHGDKSFVIGAGAGPWPYANTNCEVNFTIILINKLKNNLQNKKIRKKFLKLFCR